MTKILNLEISNVLAITAAHIEADGKPVVIGGKNAAGKSSVLAAIEMAIGGGKRIPQEPMHHGATKAHVILDTEEYRIERHWTKSGNSTLKVTAKDGAAVRKPQDLLDKFIGSLSFDPLAFERMKPRDQREVLMRLAGLDFSADDAKREALFQQRTDVNREVKRLEGAIEKAPPVPAGTPTDEVSVAALADELEARRKHNTSIDSATAQHESATRIVADLDRKIADMQRDRDEMKRRADALAATLAKAERQDEAEVRAQIDSAEARNVAARAAKAKEALHAELGKATVRADHLTTAIEAIDKAKADAVAAAKFPVAGLAVDDEGVRLGDVPFAQASQAERLRASVAIGAANSPALRVMLVRDGALLDADSMKLLAEIAAEHDVQTWVEVVGDRDECTVIIEDGHVRGEGE